MAEDKLFETGCCAACGSPSLGDRSMPGYSEFAGAKLCDVCGDNYVGVLETKIKNRRKSASPPAALKVGDFGTCPGGRPGVIGSFGYVFDGEPGAYVTMQDTGSMRVPYVLRSLRPAPAPSEQIPDEFYGTCPEDAELPATLPAGTKWMNTASRDYCGEALEELRREGGCYRGRFTLGGKEHSIHPYVSAKFIDWKSVRKPQLAQTPVAGKGAEAFTGCISHGCHKPHGHQDECGSPPCSHPRRFPSGMCTTCGELGAITGDFTDAAGNVYPLGVYAITPRESDSEAASRREGIARTQRILGCPHVNRDELGDRCLDCGVSGKEFHILRTHEPRNRSNYGEGPLAKRIEKAKAEVLADISKPRTWKDKLGRTVSFAGRVK